MPGGLPRRRFVCCGSDADAEDADAENIDAEDADAADVDADADVEAFCNNNNI